MANPNGVFGGGNENPDGDGQSSDCIQEYLQEINEFIVKGLYKDIFGSSLGMSREEAEFQAKQEQLASWVTPGDFGIPPE